MLLIKLDFRKGDNVVSDMSADTQKNPKQATLEKLAGPCEIYTGPSSYLTSDSSPIQMLHCAYIINAAHI